MIFLYLFLVVCLTGDIQSDDSLPIIERGIDEFIAQNFTKPDYLQNAIDNMFNVKSKSAKNKAICDFCVTITNAFIKLKKSGASRETLFHFARDICVWFDVKKQPLCEGYIDLQIDSALYILEKNPELSAEHICAIKFQENGCPDPEYDAWSIDIPPPLENHKTVIPRPTGKEELVVHITDLHYDPLYEPGANTDCEYFICCQRENGKAIKPEDGAGYWGDLKACNTPLHAIIDLLHKIVEQYSNIDRVYFTGDIVSHKVWASSKETNTQSIKTILREFKNSFKSITVFPVLGNHEAHPTDLFSPDTVKDEKLSTQWLLDLVAEEWGAWLPNDTQCTIRKGGYYTVLVKPGFRVIGLNSNLCYNYNLWLIGDNNDPHGQLKWLVATLAKAEKNNEIVHIISHVPPGDVACLKQWNHEYRRIIERFSRIISGQFYGHTHDDELKIFYSLNNPNKVINVAYVSGSFTSFIGRNPGYRVYEIESSNWNVNNYYQWMYVLKDANALTHVPPNWYLWYTLDSEYGFEVSGNDLQTYDGVVQSMINNITLVELYRRLRLRASDARLKKPCDKECLADLFCSITNVEFEDSSQCKAFRTKYL